MRTAKNLVWLAIGTVNVALGYFLWDWAAWPVGGMLVAFVGLGLIADAASNLRRPKVVKFNSYKGVVWQ